MSAREYYILDTDRPRGDLCRWWKPRRMGYTCNLDEAGLYTEAQARSEQGVAVHRDDARKAAAPVVDLGSLRETGALDVHDLRVRVLDAWKGRPLDCDEAEDALGWTEVRADLVRRWHSTDVHRRYEWVRVAASVREDCPGNQQRHWPEVEVTIEQTENAIDGEVIEATTVRAKIGKVKLSEVRADKSKAMDALVEAAMVRGAMERGET
jgi:hypothetical protein